MNQTQDKALISRQNDLISSLRRQLDEKENEVKDGEAHEIFNQLSAASREKILCHKLNKIIDDAYKFEYVYDGTLGEIALKFRSKIVAFGTKSRKYRDFQQNWH